MPCLSWVRDEEAKHVRGNSTIFQLGKENVTGKTDHESIWAANADTLRAADKKVFEIGQACDIRERDDKSGHGKRP